MYRIENITKDPKQKQTLSLPNGKFIEFKYFYSQMQYGWFISYIKYEDFILTGVRITNSPDMLYQFRNQIPFGMACFTEGNREPTQIDDFASGAAKLYVLTEEEVQAYSVYLSG